MRVLSKQASFGLDGNYRSMSLESVFTLLNDVSIFYSYVREDVPFVNRLADVDQDVVIIAPTNEAIAQLGKKPWEFPRDIESMEREGANEKEIDTAIRNNVIDFVRSHVIFEDTNSFFREENDYATIRSANKGKQEGMDDDGDILVKNVDGSFLVASSRDKEFHEVKHVETSVNGVVLVIDSCLAWPDF